jgi:hypothetical protein
MPTCGRPEEPSNEAGGVQPHSGLISQKSADRIPEISGGHLERKDISMAFTIYSDIPNHVVRVQTDMQGTRQVVSNQANNPTHVDLSFAEVNVALDGVGNIQQAPRVLGIENGDRFRVILDPNTNLVRIERV